MDNLQDPKLAELLKTVDRSKFNNQSFSQKIPKPWGYEILWVPEDKPYMGKVMHIEAGKRLSLQLHDQKMETYFLMNGRAKLIWENAIGNLIETVMETGCGYSTEVGQQHRIQAIEDCDLMEVSLPETGTTYRLEDDYDREHETEEMRKDPNRGWNSTD